MGLLVGGGIQQYGLRALSCEFLHGLGSLLIEL
jgi:hypothetical protein